MTSLTIDPFAEQEKLPSVSFKDVPVGTWYEGDVVEAPSFAQSRDYDTNEPLFWQPNKKQSTQPTEQPVMSIVTVLEINGERRGLWASKWNKPGSMFSAIQEAQKTAGAQVTVGGRLAVGLIGIEPSDNPKFNDRKLYAARYTPPNPFAGAPDWAQEPDPQTGEVPMPQPAATYNPQAASQGQSPWGQQPQTPYSHPQAQPQTAYAQTAPQQAKQHSPEVLAALKAAGVDPASVPVK